MTSSLLNLLRYVLWSGIWSVLVNNPFEPEKNVRSAGVG